MKIGDYLAGPQEEATASHHGFIVRVESRDGYNRGFYSFDECGKGFLCTNRGREQQKQDKGEKTGVSALVHVVNPGAKMETSAREGGSRAGESQLSEKISARP
jgi:hypothetical protein